jgi:hypothetical protein
MTVVLTGPCVTAAIWVVWYWALSALCKTLAWRPSPHCMQCLAGSQVACPVCLHVAQEVHLPLHPKETRLPLALSSCSCCPVQDAESC